MKKNLLASVAVFALAAGAPAVAADLPIKAPVHKAATAPMSHNWTGCYVGAHVGYGWGHASSYDYDADHLRPSGIFGGGQLGCNWQQTANWVWGIEADIAGADIHDRVFGFKNSDLSYLGTVRGRIGLSQANWLVYGTGGFAYGGNKISISGCGPECDANRTYTGWSAGGGIERIFAPNWSVKIEYLHIDLGKELSFCCADIALKVDTIKLGVNWRFNAGLPVPK